MNRYDNAYAEICKDNLPCPDLITLSTSQVYH